MPLQGILVQILYVWGINIIGPFTPLVGNLYILLAEDYVSKWVEAIACLRNDVNCSVICMYINFRLKTTKSASVWITSNIVAFFIKNPKY